MDVPSPSASSKPLLESKSLNATHASHKEIAVVPPSHLSITAMSAYENMFGHIVDVLAHAAPSWGFVVSSAVKQDPCSSDIWYVDNKVTFPKVNQVFDSCKGRKPVLAVFLGENSRRSGFGHLDPTVRGSPAARAYERAAIWLDHEGAAPNEPVSTRSTKRLAFPLWLAYFPYHRNTSRLQGSPVTPVAVHNRTYGSSAMLLARHGGNDPANLRGSIMDAFQHAGIRVNSYGKFRNNMPMLGPSHSQKLDVLQQHGYSICPENSRGPGYVTEKIFDALLAGTVPIWSGLGKAEPLIIRESAYIRWDSFTADSQWVQKARRALDGWRKNPAQQVFTKEAAWWAQTYTLRAVLGFLQHAHVGKLQQLSKTNATFAQAAAGSVHYWISRQVGKAGQVPATSVTGLCAKVLLPLCSQYQACLYQQDFQARDNGQELWYVQLECRSGVNCSLNTPLRSRCLDAAAVFSLRYHVHTKHSLFAPAPFVHLGPTLSYRKGVDLRTLLSCDVRERVLSAPALVVAQVGGFSGFLSKPGALEPACLSALDLEQHSEDSHSRWWLTWRQAAEWVIPNSYNY